MNKKIKNIETNLVFGCADDRLKGRVAKKWIKENLKLKNNPIVVYWPGTTHDFIYSLPSISIFLFSRIFLLIKEKKVERIIIWQHGDCLAYKKYNLSPDSESKKQIGDMIRAKAVLKNQFPKLEVVLLYAKLIDIDKKFEFEIVL